MRNRRSFCTNLMCSLATMGAVGLGGTAQAHHITASRSAAARESRIKQMILEEASQLGVSPSLAMAVAHVESFFNPRALSHAGARGVMQIMPATARGEYGIQADALWDPRLNIRLGLHFLNRLIDRYQGRVDLALSYYNGGSAVGTLPNARIIPATRSYVSKVLKLRTEYRTKLLNGQI